MKRTDLIFIGAIMVLFLPFALSQTLYDYYCSLNSAHGLMLSFLKFAVLATMGEALGLRIRRGVYSYSGFGLLPRAIVWGLLGVGIKISFIVFQNGAVALLSYLHYVADGSIGSKLLLAFTASTLLNLIFAPVMMTIHKITDTHILHQGGRVGALLHPIDVSKILQEVDWKVMWGFVFKKTLPFFWIPAHTITFLLPASFQVLFAAILGIVLGVILAFAANKSN